jgi:hypothetical protein
LISVAGLARREAEVCRNLSETKWSELPKFVPGCLSIRPAIEALRRLFLFVLLQIESNASSSPGRFARYASYLSAT